VFSQDFTTLKQQLIAQDISVLVVDDIAGAYGYGWYGIDFMVIATDSPHLSSTILHELGHNCNLHHNGIDYNVLRGPEGEEAAYEATHPGYRSGRDINWIHENQASAFVGNNPYPLF